MKLLETCFLILTIAIPLFLIVFGLANKKHLKRNKKFRTRLALLILISILINGTLFGGLKMYNDKKDDNAKESDTLTNNDKDTNTNKTSNGFKIETIDGVTYVDGYMIVNKTYPLPEDYVPENTHIEVSSSNCQECIINEAYDAYQEMRSDASSQGLSLWIASGYRSYTYQSKLYDMYVNNRGKEAADTFSARPGYSEHQSGYAFDLNSVSDAFATTKEGVWINDNCYKYGFILRYPKDKEDETGYKYESWHLRYVGTELAEKLYNNGDWITMEKYFGLTSTYAS